MKIYITDQILSGNMGDGWADECAAAHAYALYAEQQYVNTVQGLYQDAAVVVDIDVQCRTTGISREPSVVVEDVPHDEEYKVQSRVEDAIADLRVWDTWMDTPEAAQLAAPVSAT